MKLTVLPLPIEKLSQVIVAEDVDWLIVITSDVLLIEAEPDTTEPSTGKESAIVGCMLMIKEHVAIFIIF